MSVDVDTSQPSQIRIRYGGVEPVLLVHRLDAAALIQLIEEGRQKADELCRALERVRTSPISVGDPTPPPMSRDRAGALLRDFANAWRESLESGCDPMMSDPASKLHRELFEALSGST